MRSNRSAASAPEMPLPAPMNTCSKSRLRRARAGAHERVVGRHVAPAEQPLSFFLRDARQERFHRLAIVGVVRQEHQARAVGAGFGQRERHDGAQERVGHLEQDAGAVTGVGLAAAGAAVLEIDEHLQGFLDDVVRPRALHVDDEADAARVVFRSRIVQTLASRLFSGSRLCLATG